MKQNNVNKILRPGILLFLFYSSIILTVSCKKNDITGPPIITSVSLLDPAKQDSTFDKAFPGTQVLIEGTDIGGITAIYFNDFPAYFNPTYNTSTHLIVTIPSDAPTEATNAEVPNTIHLVTDHGETSFQFSLDIPAPYIASVSNENALPGDSVIVWGSNLWLIEKIILPGGKEVTEMNTTETGYRLAFVMPDIGSDTGRLILQGKYGTSSSNGPLNDHESSDVISNLTAGWESGEASVFNWAWWGGNRSTDLSLYPGTRGAYLQNNFDAGAADGGWWNGNRSGNFTEVVFFNDLSVLTQPAENYALKFEVNTKNPWTAGIDVIRFHDTYAYRYMPYTSSASKVFDTRNTWQTVTIPFSEFKLAEGGIEGTGAGATTVQDIAPEGKINFSYRFITETDPVTGFDAAFDNFRIIKIK